MSGTFISDYVAYASEYCDAPKIFHEYMARALIGLACRNHIYYQFGDTKIFNNIWLMFIAPSGFRKSAAMKLGLKVMYATDETYKLPDEFSPETIVPILKDHPYGTFFFSEFDKFISNLKKDYMGGLKGGLVDLSDVPDHPLVKELRKEKFVVHYPCVSFLTATTVQWLIDNIRESDIGSGFLPRYLVLSVNERGKTFFPEEVNEVAKNKLVKELHNIMDFIGIKEGYVGMNKMTFNPETRSRYIKWLDKFEKSYDDKILITPFYIRMPVFVLKFAMIEALNETSMEIKNNHLEKAIEMIAISKDSLETLNDNEFSFTDYGKSKLRIVNKIKDSPGGSITMAMLCKKVQDIPRRTRQDVVNDLVESGIVIETNSRSPHAKKNTVHLTINENKLSQVLQ